MFGLEMKMTRKWHESAMKAPWKCHESGMSLKWVWHECDTVDFDNFSWQIHGTFMALSFKNSKIVEIHHIIFISYSCRFHAIFMALSWHFQPNRAPNSFMPFSWHFSWNLFQNGYIWLYHVCVCVYLSSVFLFFFWYFFIDGFSGWSKFFLFFLWSKYRVIRNTQTNNPNQQLSLSWLKNSLMVSFCCSKVPLRNYLMYIGDTSLSHLSKNDFLWNN